MKIKEILKKRFERNFNFYHESRRIDKEATKDNTNLESFFIFHSNV